MIEEIWDKIFQLKKEDLNVSKQEIINKSERLTILEEQLIDLGVEQEVLESELIEYRAKLYYKIQTYSN